MKQGNSWIRIARCNDIPLREGRAVKVGDREIAIFNLGDRFLAVNNRCPHRGGPLADGLVSDAAVVCPLHAWKFSLETGESVNSASAVSCVETFRTKIENGIIVVELNPLEHPKASIDQELRAICAPESVAASGMEDIRHAESA